MDRDDGYAIRLRIFYRICQQIQKYTFQISSIEISSSEKSTLIIAFELLIIEFMERSTSKDSFKFNSSIWELVAFFYLKQLYIHLAFVLNLLLKILEVK
jgi:hypothetical protein